MKAFPAISKEPMDDGEGCWFTPSSEGMELRDYFAAKAMQAIITNDNLLKSASVYHGTGSEDSIARLSYEQADAMMKAREYDYK
jgi:hypothetical protein